MGVVKSLPIELPRIDADTQSRIKINDDVVEEYADIIAESNGDWPFPPIDVFHDGTDYYTGNGFHRLLGALRTKRGSIPCRIHTGTARDARIFGMTANDKQGLRMTRADKRACVEWLLDKGGKMTQAAIAEAAGVTSRTVKKIVTERKFDSLDGKASPPKRDGKGKTSPYTPIRGDSKPVDATETPEPDYGKCPNCAGTKWDDEEEGVSCSKCHHPHGEPAGDVDEDRMTTQRQKTVKTLEAAIRAFDDLQVMKARAEHPGVVDELKAHIVIARNWK